MTEKALVVFTFKSREHLVTEIGGTASWSLNLAKVQKCRFAVCTRNTDPRKCDEIGWGGGEPHGAAFLVGRISGVRKEYVRNGRQRYRVTFDAVAQVLVEGIWDGSRVPVRYMSLDELASKGLNIEELDFQEIDRSIFTGVSQHENAFFSRERGEVSPLTIAEAKRGLAAKFEVSESEIEIVIKG